MNKHMQKYPPRPIINDSIRREAAKNWVQEYFPGDDEEIQNELLEVLSSEASLGDDGFELGKMVEDETTITVDFQLCEALNEFSSCLYNAWRKAEKVWKEDNHIEPPFPIGTRVQYSTGFSKQIGIIISVHEYATAKYVIKDEDYPDDGFVTIHFEDVEAIEEGQ